MKAIKCDRCGIFATDLLGVRDLNIGGEHGILVDQSYPLPVVIDLCVPCRDELLKFLKGAKLVDQ